MSLTTESSLRRGGSDQVSLRQRFAKVLCPCLPQRRKISPKYPLSYNSNFMSFGKKGQRVVCVTHYQPGLNDLAFASSTDAFPCRLKKFVLNESNDDDTESQTDEYWFSKWTVPLRTVKRFQLENAQKNIFRQITNRLASFRKSGRGAAGQHAATGKNVISNFAIEQSAQIIKQASLEIAKSKSKVSPVPVKSESVHSNGGVVNAGFVGSPNDPDATNSCAPPPVPHSNTTKKPLLYFIHGAGESSESWRNITQYFTLNNYEVLTLDLLGHGFSSTPDRPGSYTFRKLLADVIQVFDEHVYKERKAVLIGHGYGCSFAVALSRQRTNSITLLALLSSGGPTPLAPPVTWRREPKLPASMLRCLRSFLPCGMKRHVLYGPRGKSCIHETEQFLSLPTYVQRHLAVGQSWLEGDVAFHRKITVPTLLVHGLKDKFVSLVEMCEMERTIPRAFLEVIPESGHDIMAEEPDQICKMLKKFIEYWER